MWGKNSEVGDGTWEDCNSPVKVLENVQTVSLKSNYSGAVTKDGVLYMWGGNFAGKLGDGTSENRNSLVKVLESVQSISLVGNHSGAVTKEGTLYMWGYDTKIGKNIYYGSWSRPRRVKLKKGRKTGQASYSIVG